MVYYKDSEAHFSDILKTMNDLRLENSVCDVSLVIGHQKTDAHRCILAAGSDYFRTRFCGPFKIENDHDIDLSDITENYASVESVVNFLYTGKIEIDQFNIESVLKISSFFLISKIRDFCLKFMRNSLCLDTYLKYYLLAVDHGFPELEHKLVLTLKSRFHDCLIHRESSLDISPGQLSYLIMSNNIFEHCSTSDIIQYILDWVTYGATEEYEKLGSEIMDNIASKPVSREIFDENTAKLLQNKVQQMDTYVTLYKGRLSGIVAKYLDSWKSSSETQTCKSLRNKKQPLTRTQHYQYLENVLITVSPKACLRKDYEKFIKDKYRHKSSLEDGTLVYDICVYVPGIGVWYYLDHATKGNNIFNYLYGTSNGVLTKRLCCLFDECQLVTFCGLQDLSEKDISYEHIRDNLPLRHLSINEYCVVADDQTVYIVLEVRIHDDDEYESYHQVYFTCYKLTKDDTWYFMFSTVNTPLPIDEDIRIFCASVSSVSNEMIIAYKFKTESLHICVVNMSEENKFIFIEDTKEDVVETHPSADAGVHVEPFSISDTDDSEWGELDRWLRGVDEEEEIERRKKPHYKETSLHILQQNDHFYVIEAQIPPDPSEKSRLLCKYRYKFSSKSLAACENELLLDNNGIYCNEGSSCSHHAVTSDHNSIWFYHGNKKDGSSLTQVTIDESGNFVRSFHTPPPFSYISSAVTGTVNMECLKRMKPLKCYLTD